MVTDGAWDKAVDGELRPGQLQERARPEDRQHRQVKQRLTRRAATERRRAAPSYTREAREIVFDFLEGVRPARGVLGDGAAHRLLRPSAP